MKPVFKAPGIMRLKPKYNKILISKSIVIKFNLRRYSTAGSAALVCRGTYLATAFAPVVMFAIPLLLLAEWAAAMRFLAALSSVWSGRGRGAAAGGGSGGGGGGGRGGVMATMTPAAMAAAAAAEWRAFLRCRAWILVHFSVSICGAALVKWAQWAGAYTRPLLSST